MSKFDELCASYEKLLTSAEAYEVDCQNFAKKLVKGFVDYLECGKNDIVLEQLELGEDGYYNCNLELAVYESDDKYASRGYVPEIHLKVARNVDEFIVKVATGSKVYAFSKDETNFDILFDDLFRGIKSYYETPVDSFIHRNMRGLITFP